MARTAMPRRCRAGDSSSRPDEESGKRMQAKKISPWLAAIFCLAAPLSCTSQSPQADAVSEFAAIKPHPYVGLYDYLPATGGPTTEVIVQDGADFKVADLGGKNSATENFDLGGRLMTCINRTGAWSCRNVGNELSLAPGATLSPARTLAVMTRIFGDQQLSKSSQVMNGVRLQCLTGAGKDEQRTLCLTARGVIGYSRTVISGQAFTLILAKVTMSVPPGQFLLPATPAPGVGRPESSPPPAPHPPSGTR
jgi:hypothetical protein